MYIRARAIAAPGAVTSVLITSPSITLELREAESTADAAEPILKELGKREDSAGFFPPFTAYQENIFKEA